MNNLLFTTMVAQASSLYNTSSLESAADMSGKVFGAITGVFSIFMVISSIIPIIVFGMAFFIIFKAIKSQSSMRKDINNMSQQVKNKVNEMNNMDTTVKTESQPKTKPDYTSPINNDPNGVIDLDNVIGANNTDPIKRG